MVNGVNAAEPNKGGGEKELKPLSISIISSKLGTSHLGRSQGP